jgi:hypothetical protein
MEVLVHLDIIVLSGRHLHKLVQEVNIIHSGRNATVMFAPKDIFVLTLLPITLNVMKGITAPMALPVPNLVPKVRTRTTLWATN